MEYNNKISLVMDDGKIVEHDVVASFYLDETNKKYIVFTDGEYDDKKLNVYIVSSIDNNEFEFIKDDNEFNMIIEKLNDIGFDGVDYEK